MFNETKDEKLSKNNRIKIVKYSGCTTNDLKHKGNLIRATLLRATLVNSSFLVPTNSKNRVGRSEIKKNRK